MEKLSEHGCFGGQVAYCKHSSEVLGCEMGFTVFTPPDAIGKSDLL